MKDYLKDIRAALKIRAEQIESLKAKISEYESEHHAIKAKAEAEEDFKRFTELKLRQEYLENRIHAVKKEIKNLEDGAGMDKAKIIELVQEIITDSEAEAEKMRADFIKDYDVLKAHYEEHENARREMFDAITWIKGNVYPEASTPTVINPLIRQYIKDGSNVRYVSGKGRE